ncbi:MAG: hypothetical protein IJT18_04140 [Oscillospiraceae bacterium]|nr:hypothetical protein [Oscillospiraceae bacterium]
MKKLLAITLVMATLLTLLAGCSLGATEEPAKVTPENPTLETDLGVKVDFPAFLLEDEGMEVKVASAGTVEADNGDWKLEAYDISAGDTHELDTYIEIRLPYTDDFCKAGDPAKCVAAKYLNETTNQWEDVLYTVDEENHEVVITTDHFSIYGCFYVDDEGKRSAYISEVYDWTVVPDELAIGALSEWASTGQAGDACYKVADVFLQDMIKDVALKSAGEAGDYAGNLYTVTQMGDFQFDSKSLATANEKFGKAIGRLGKVAAAANIAYTICNPGKTPEDIMGLYKDCFNFALSFSEEAALGISMVGVWVIDKSLFTFGEEVQNMRVATVAPIYRYFNDKFDGNSDNYKGLDRARTSAEWLAYLKKLTKATHGDQETFKLMLEQEVDSYARRWFDLPIARQEDYAVYISTIVKSGSSASSYWYSALSPTEKENMITAYKGELYDRLIPMMNKVQIDNRLELEKQQMQALKEVQALLNASSQFRIYEVVEQGAEPTLAGYKIRFADLNDKAVVKNWTGKLGKDGSVSDSMTGIAWLIVGCPSKINLYEPDADPDNDDPVQVIPFKYTFSDFEVPIVPALYPTIDEICGVYEGLVTITAVDAPPGVKEALKESECEIDLDAMIGEQNETELTFTKTGDTTVNFSAEDTVVPLTYDEKTGKLVGSATLEEETISMELQCNYDEPKQTILLSGTMVVVMSGEDMAGLKITIDVLGNKAL